MGCRANAYKKNQKTVQGADGSCKCPPEFVQVKRVPSGQQYCVPKKAVCGQDCHAYSSDQLPHIPDYTDAVAKTTCSYAPVKPDYPPGDGEYVYKKVDDEKDESYRWMKYKALEDGCHFLNRKDRYVYESY
jgi:hypothetical protein